MVERGGELGLADEPLAEPLVLRELGREYLERDLALQADVLGEVDRAHPPAAEGRLDPVPLELTAGRNPRAHAGNVLHTGRGRLPNDGPTTGQASMSRTPTQSESVASSTAIATIGAPTSMASWLPSWGSTR
jgi:hypothetical protein